MVLFIFWLRPNDWMEYNSLRWLSGTKKVLACDTSWRQRTMPAYVCTTTTLRPTSHVGRYPFGLSEPTESRGLNLSLCTYLINIMPLDEKYDPFHFKLTLIVYRPNWIEHTIYDRHLLDYTSPFYNHIYLRHCSVEQPLPVKQLCHRCCLMIRRMRADGR